MARSRRSSRLLDNSTNRLTGFRTLNPNLDLGNGLNVYALAQMVTNLQIQLDAYNSTIARLDQMADQITEMENAIAHLSGKMLTAVGLTYGTSSDEYQMAGGKKRKRKSPVTANAQDSVSPILMVSLDNKNGSSNGNGNGKSSKAIAR
jgi:hypothetical protein